MMKFDPGTKQQLWTSKSGEGTTTSKSGEGITTTTSKSGEEITTTYDNFYEKRWQLNRNLQEKHEEINQFWDFQIELFHGVIQKVFDPEKYETHTVGICNPDKRHRQNSSEERKNFCPQDLSPMGLWMRRSPKFKDLSKKAS